MSTFRRPRARIAVAAGTALLAVALVTAGTIGLLANHPAAPTEGRTLVDLKGNQVELDTTVPPATQTQMHITESTGDHLVIPSVGLDVPLGAMSAVDGIATPPSFNAAFWLRNLGAPLTAPSTGTVYVVMHSIRGGGVGPGNAIIDVDHGTSRLTAGAKITLAGHIYKVTGGTVVRKDELASSAGIWTNTPNRLILITCLQRADHGKSIDNLIVTAQLIA